MNLNNLYMATRLAANRCGIDATGILAEIQKAMDEQITGKDWRKREQPIIDAIRQGFGVQPILTSYELENAARSLFAQDTEDK